MGDCIHCHRFMMVLALKGVTANVTTIDLRRKPEFFVKSYAGVKLPCLVHNGKVIDDVIEIEAHIERYTIVQYLLRIFDAKKVSNVLLFKIIYS